MTERGGLYYDYGLCKEIQRTTDVSILDDRLKKMKQYSLDSETLTMHDAWLVDLASTKNRVEDGHLVPEAG